MLLKQKLDEEAATDQKLTQLAISGRLMEHEAPVTGPVNLGNPQEVTIGELALLIRDLTGSRSSLRLEKAKGEWPKPPPRHRKGIEAALEADAGRLGMMLSRVSAVRGLTQ